jgi:hypothetical protein
MRFIFYAIIFSIFSFQSLYENKSVLESLNIVKKKFTSQFSPDKSKNEKLAGGCKEIFPLNFISSSDTQQIFDKELEKSLRVGISGAIFFTVKSKNKEDSGIFLTGKDIKGEKWEVDFSDETIGLGYEMYEADFDNNGIKDFLFITYTPANGFLPSSIFHFVMFEPNGRPIPFYVAFSQYQIQKSGIWRLMDCNNDRKAELIVEDYQYSEDGDKWKGHYITNVYQAKNARWKKQIKYLNRNLPVYTSFDTYTENRQGEVLIPLSEKPKQKRKPFSPNRENFSAVFQAKKILVKEDGESAFAFVADINGKRVSIGREVADSCYLNTVLVIDSVKERKIKTIFEYGQWDKEVRKRYAELVEKSPKTEFFGQCSPNKISPYLIWIHQ